MFIIKTKYQYILLPFHYGIISLIAILNFYKLKKYKEIIKTILLFIFSSIVFGLIIYEIILENYNVDIIGIKLSTIYVEVINILMGYFLIRKQKESINEAAKESE